MTTQNRADDLAMLLSTDWFFGAWGMLGLSSTSKDRLAIRAGCRLIVNDVLAECDDYWEADFSPARLEKTAQHLIGLFSSADVDNHDQETIKKLTYGTSSVDGLTPQASLVFNLIWLLISEYRLNEEMRAAVSESAFEHIEAAAISASDSEDLIVRLGSVQSTEWDERLKRATTDNPNHLIDVAREMSRQIDAFPKLWNHLRERLSEREFASLCVWLSQSSQLLAGKDVLGSR
jgi:hypothetical protein